MAYESQQKAKSENQNTKNQKTSSERPFNFYGIRETRNKKYMSVTLVRSDENGKKEWLNVPINVKYTTIGDNYCLLALKLLTASKDVDL